MTHSFYKLKSTKKTAFLCLPPESGFTGGFMKKNATVLKIVSIGAVILALGIGNTLIGNKLDDRQECYYEAREEIGEAAGNSFFLSNLCVVIPVSHFTQRLLTDGTKTFEETSTTYEVISPKQITIDSDLKSETRTLGIYSMPIYNGSLKINADFDLKEFIPQEKEVYHFEKAVFLLSVSDRCIENHPIFFIENTKKQTYLTKINEKLQGIACDFNYKSGTYHFSTNLNIHGAFSFIVSVLSEDTNLNIVSDWPSPGFSGFDYLPTTRELNENGFTASWKIPFAPVESKYTIGFDYQSGIDLYKKLDRAVNYAFLFIIVPFIVLFLFEAFAGFHLNSIQYLLSGAASIIFFLLLMSFSEHISFEASYIIASFASGTLISLYIGSISKKIKIGITMAGVFLLLYSYLYLSLQSEDYALLIGSLFALFIVGILMFFTRKEKDITIIQKSNLKLERKIEDCNS